MRHIAVLSQLMVNTSSIPRYLMLPPATSQEITRVKAIVGTLLYNSRALDPTLLVPLVTLTSQLSTATSATIDAVSHLLDYYSTCPEASISQH
jgi:hypothetical protein